MKKTMRLNKGTPKEIVLKADRAVFGQMIVIAEVRDLSMREVLSHPLGPIPWSLASIDGSLKKTTKASLAKDLQKDIPAVDNLPSDNTCIIDGMAMVQKLKPGITTFKEVANILLAMALREGVSSKRVDVVFDDYRETSIKNPEREKRGAENENCYRDIRPEHKVPQWKKFLANPENKKQLIQFVVNQWRGECCRKRLGEKRLYATAGEQCYEITAEGSVICTELRCTQEEADTRLILHAYHAGRNGSKVVVIVSDDTDVFILLLAFKCFISATLLLKCGQQARTRFIDISQVVERHGTEVCRSLPGFHAFTGCDSVSAFSGKGKVTPLKLVKRHAEFIDLFQALGTEWKLSDELFARLQKFTCHMYSRNPVTSDINDIRYGLFCAKRGDVDSSQLPPCANTLRKHCQRANYQAGIWRRSLQGCPQIPSPFDHGWKLEDDQLQIDWMTSEPAPKAVLELLSCQCRKKCELPQCTCLKNGLNCTDLCRLQECENRNENPEPEINNEEIDSDDDDDD